MVVLVSIELEFYARTEVTANHTSHGIAGVVTSGTIRSNVVVGWQFIKQILNRGVEFQILAVLITAENIECHERGYCAIWIERLTVAVGLQTGCVI